MNPVYSIIIPHYNTPDLLMRCLRSIPIRKDVQVIVVDDCSPDASGYLQKYSELQRPFLEFYSTSEGGSAGRARNIGLQHASGEWCLFADADDYYVEGFLDVIDKHLEDNLDILYFNVAGEGKRSKLHQQIFDLYKSNNDESEVRYHIWAPWNKVISHQFIVKNNLRFEEIPVGNDAMFCLKASKLAQNYRIIENKLYCLTDNEGSISYKRCTFEREFDYTQIRTRITKFMTELGLQYKYGYHIFSIARAKRFWKEYGWKNSLRFVSYISRNYGLVNALVYNFKRKKFQKKHPELIYCD